MPSPSLIVTAPLLVLELSSTEMVTCLFELVPPVASVRLIASPSSRSSVITLPSWARLTASSSVFASARFSMRRPRASIDREFSLEGVTPSRAVLLPSWAMKRTCSSALFSSWARIVEPGVKVTMDVSSVVRSINKNAPLAGALLNSMVVSLTKV